MSSSSTSSYGPITSGTKVTSYLPLTSTWSAPSECSSLFLDSGSVLFLYSPEYQNDVVGAPACLPPEISSWWYQPLSTASATVTLLGGYDFDCPEQYTTIYSVVSDSATTIGCCPYSYDYRGTIHNYGTPFQCSSTLPAGTITYVQSVSTGSFFTTTSQYISTPTAIYGVQVNGYLFGDSAATTLSSSSSTTPSTLSSSSVATNSSTVNNSSGLSQGAKIGVGIGVSLGVVGLASLVVVLLLFKRTRHKRNQRTIALSENPPYQKPELDSNTLPMSNTNSEMLPYEIGPSRNDRPLVAELG